jgi:hypothetical protein
MAAAPNIILHLRFQVLVPSGVSINLFIFVAKQQGIVYIFYGFIVDKTR